LDDGLLAKTPHCHPTLWGVEVRISGDEFSYIEIDKLYRSLEILSRSGPLPALRVPSLSPRWRALDMNVTNLLSALLLLPQILALKSLKFDVQPHLNSMEQTEEYFQRAGGELESFSLWIDSYMRPETSGEC
jgi:hypothetical protein